MIVGLERSRRLVAEGGVPALAVVEDLDEVEDRRPCLLAGRPGEAVDELDLEGGEEALGDGVIPAGARPAEALGDAVAGEEPGVVGGGVLAAAIGVVDQAGRRAAGG